MPRKTHGPHATQVLVGDASMRPRPDAAENQTATLRGWQIPSVLQ